MLKEYHRILQEQYALITIVIIAIIIIIIIIIIIMTIIIIIMLTRLKKRPFSTYSLQPLTAAVEYHRIFQEQCSTCVYPWRQNKNRILRYSPSKKVKTEQNQSKKVNPNLSTPHFTNNNNK